MKMRSRLSSPLREEVEIPNKWRHVSISLSAGCGISSSLSFLLYTVFLLNEASSERLLFSFRCIAVLLDADPSLLTWLRTSLSAGLPRWSFLALLPLSCFKHVWHRFLGCLSLLCGAFHALFLSGSRSATCNLATALLSARGRASVCSGPCCESSSGPSVLSFALVESLQFSAQL